MSLHEDAVTIMDAALHAALPDTAVKNALSKITFGSGKRILVAVGKAAWQMARAASDALEGSISSGIVITKYGHAKGELPHIVMCEAGHPVPDANSSRAPQAAIALVRALHQEDTVLFLISGGGSALFEKPLVSAEAMDSVTRQLLACGADIVEMNTVRKRLSGVKGGRFAQLCAPAHVCSIVLSDIIGDPLDMIASGPAYPDGSTCEQAKAIVEKYGLKLDAEVQELLSQETPKQLDNVETYVTGSVRQLCQAAGEACVKLGYEPVVLTASLSGEAREAGTFLANIAQYYQDSAVSRAFIAGGETVVHLTGKGLGGRNQELALSAAAGIAGLKDTAVFSLGSDGTDGPTDAAGGYVDQDTAGQLKAQGIHIFEVLQNNDAYHALQRCGGLIMTGPTGTNVNDVAVLLIKRD